MKRATFHTEWIAPCGRRPRPPLRNQSDRRHTGCTPAHANKNVRKQRGVVAIEFALMLMFGMIPLLWLTFTGVMIFASKQSLTLAAADGARAALRYAPDMNGRIATAESVGRARMDWLYNYSATAPNVVAVATISHCGAVTAAPSHITVTASYDYASAPIFPASEFVAGVIQDKAVVQLPQDICQTNP